MVDYIVAVDNPASVFPPRFFFAPTNVIPYESDMNYRCARSGIEKISK